MRPFSHQLYANSALKLFAPYFMLSISPKLLQNSLALDQELAWFEQFLYKRAEYHQQKPAITFDFLLSQIPPLPTDNSLFGQLLQSLYEETAQSYQNEWLACRYLAERVVLMLALVPHVRPQLLDIFFHQNEYNRDFTEFGGVRGVHHKGFLPTGETAMFILAGSNLELRFEFQSIFHPRHFFNRHNILRLENSPNSEPLLSGQLFITDEYLKHLTTGEPYEPQYSSNFPANRIETQLDWADLVLDYDTFQDIQEVRAWVRNYKTLMADPWLGRELRGFRCLFYGESGTGKTLTTKLLGKELGLEVYRIDLAKIVSKYIGETEKNLNAIFEMAKYRDWVLFFDEGDALFGKRTDAKSSNDRYANQETAFLLQKIEEHPGILILATNLRSNLDKAFIRRFQAEVYFGIPSEHSRLLLWQKAFSQQFQLDSRIDLTETARKYVITGAAIKNVQLHCAVMCLDREDKLVSYEDFKDGLRKQLLKEGKTI